MQVGYFIRVGSFTAGLLFVVLLMASSVSEIRSQQPFVTDDADVTEKRKFHFETANEFDRLQSTVLPLDYQNCFRAALAYGVIKNLEIGVTGQFLTLVSTDHPHYVAGIGDTMLAAKYLIRKEVEGSKMPAFAVSGFIQFPTGNPKRSLGSGKTDYGLNVIAQRSYREKNVFRGNAGYYFAGNTLTGVLGISVVKGHVFTAAGSYVRTINDKLQLGGELAGAVTSNFQLSRGQFQTQFGGNYNLTKHSTLDFGLIAGKYAASPRIGFQIGYSIDF